MDKDVECLRFLNWLILTLLKEKSDLLLYKMLTYENTITELLVKIFNSVVIDFNTPDSNFSYGASSEKLMLAFLLLKALVLLKLRNGISNHTDTKPQGVNPISFWMSIWPAIRRVLDMIEPTTLFTVIYID